MHQWCRIQRTLMYVGIIILEFIPATRVIEERISVVRRYLSYIICLEFGVGATWEWCVRSCPTDYDYLLTYGQRFHRWLWFHRSVEYDLKLGEGGDLTGNQMEVPKPQVRDVGSPRESCLDLLHDFRSCHDVTVVRYPNISSRVSLRVQWERIILQGDLPL